MRFQVIFRTTVFFSYVPSILSMPFMLSTAETSLTQQKEVVTEAKRQVQVLNKMLETTHGLFWDTFFMCVSTHRCGAETPLSSMCELPR